jgi:WD40 repeat protein
MQHRSKVHISFINCLCFDRTGRYILTGSDDKTIKVFSCYDGRLMATLRGHEGKIVAMAINFENSLLASGDDSNMVRIWNLNTKKNIEILKGHQFKITSVEVPYFILFLCIKKLKTK